MNLATYVTDVFYAFKKKFRSDLFDPHWYISEFYPTDIGDENRSLMSAHFEVCREIRKRHPRKKMHVLDLAGGGTLWSEIISSIFFNEITYSDFIEKNCRVAKNYAVSPDDYWDEYISFVLNKIDEFVLQETIEEIKTSIRKRMKEFIHCDVFQTHPLGKKVEYDVVIANFVMDSVVDDKETWKRLMRNASSLVKHKGYFIISSLAGSNGYYSNALKQFQPAVYLKINDVVVEMKKIGYDVFYKSEIPAEKGHSNQYSGLMVVAGEKK